MSMAFLGAMAEASEQALEQALQAMQLVSTASQDTTPEKTDEKIAAAAVMA